MTPEVERKLAAILSGDVVGYSRLMAEDEDATVRGLAAYREEIELLVRQQRGRVVDFTGDNFLAEFPTATAAVTCAVEVQGILKVRNAPLPADRRLEFRMGVHLAEVRVENDRLYGDGVNIAARLEAMADPGGICISGEVHGQVGRKLEVAFEDLGDRSVKNIPRPVRVYRVRPTGGVRRARRSLVPLVALGVMSVVTLLIVGAVLRNLFEERFGDRGIDDRFLVPGYGNVPAIAILAFEDMSPEGDHGWLADGLAEELITRLSSGSRLPVIARNSSFTYKGRAVDVEQVGEELGARYVIEGSVRKAGERIRISAQLIDTTNGHHVWAKTYDRDLRDIFAVQDDITKAIVAEMASELTWAEAARAARSEPRNLDAYQLGMRGFWHLWKGTKANNERARGLFERAAALEPDREGAFVGIAMTHTLDLLLQWTDSIPSSLARLRSAAERCLELNVRSAACHEALASFYRWAGQQEPMVRSYERALELNPGSVTALWNLGVVLALAGRSEEAITHLRTSLRLSPKDRLWWGFQSVGMALAHFGAGRYEDAIDWSKRALPDHLASTFGWRILAVCYARLGRLDEARSAAQEVLRAYPEFSVSHVATEFAAADPGFLERFLDGLRKAGVPEE